MDLFPDGALVRLRRTTRRGARLHLEADEDGVKVSLSSRSSSSPTSIWAVHRVEREGFIYVLLHSAAYGRYLALAPGRGWSARGSFVAVQRAYDDPHQLDIFWQPVVAVPGAGGGVGDVRLRNLRYGYLCKVGRLRTIVNWNVQAIPTRPEPPVLVQDRHQLLPRLSVRNLFRRCKAEDDNRRVIQYLRSEERLDFSQANVPTFYFYGRSFLKLRFQVGIRVSPKDIFGTRICVKAGLYGRLTPLFTDLPQSEEPMDIVVYSTAAADENTASLSYLHSLCEFQPLQL
ncbi:unnamed protein product [Urochloa humidicola]